MSAIDRVGTFIGTIIEGVVNLSSNGLPQWVIKLQANKRYIGTKDEMEHFKLTEPGYVDWPVEWGGEITGYLVLFKDPDNFTKDTQLLNYEQVKLATGWAGDSFESLNDGSQNGKEILFRVDENNYKDQIKLQVNWIDAKDAPPERSLKALEPDKLKALSGKLNIGAGKAPTKVATAPVKPVTATPPKPGPKSPATTPAPAGGAKAPTASPAAPTSPSKAPPASKPPTTPPPPTVPADEEATGYPAETTQMGAWEAVNGIKGGTSDDDLIEAWKSACLEISGGTRGDETFTAPEWAKVRDIVIKDLALTPAA